MEKKNPIQSAERIFLVLETLCNNGPMPLMELSTLLDLNKSTVHRLLTSLIYMGYVRQDEETLKYTLTYKILNMAGKFLEQTNILPLVKPYLQKLSDLTGETVHFIQRDDNDIVYIDKVESKIGSIRMASQIGLRQPLYCTGVGTAILAELPRKEVRSVWNQSEIKKITPKTITEYSALLEKLSTIQKTGYSIDDEENELGVRCVAASIKDYTGDANYAISISAPAGRMDEGRIQELAIHLLNVKIELSHTLGYDKDNQ